PGRSALLAVRKRSFLLLRLGLGGRRVGGRRRGVARLRHVVHRGGLVLAGGADGVGLVVGGGGDVVGLVVGGGDDVVGDGVGVGDDVVRGGGMLVAGAEREHGEAD